MVNISLFSYGCQELFRWVEEMVDGGNIDKLRRMLIIDGKEMEVRLHLYYIFNLKHRNITSGGVTVCLCLKAQE